MAQTKHTLECCTTLANETFPASGPSCTARDAAIYLAHTERGETLRALAQATGTHPSTVMRAVRRVEARRDDPLFDSMFKDLKQRAGQPEGAPPSANDNQAPGAVPPGSPGSSLERPELERQARRYLRRLSEPGSFLLLSPGAIKGGIFCKANEYRKPIAMLRVKLAVDFAREGWIRVARRGVGTVRYCITGDGRSFLKRLLAEDAIKRQPSSGFAETTSPFLAQHQISGERTIMDPETGKPLALKINQGEDPLGWLARRKGPDGRPFLTADEIEAGERLRTDFEIAQMGASVAQDWRKFLTPGDRYSGSPVRRGPGEGPAAARDRVASAMSHLGPGLADAALRVCCFLEGLEACERRMGWSMRSGKVVLKIALQRLHGHYVLPPARQ